MAKRPKPPGVQEMHNNWGQAIARAEERAAQFLRTARRCAVCGGTMVMNDRDRHYLCDPDSLVGRACTCPENCTKTLYGNGPAECSADCAVCRKLRGTPYAQRRKASSG